LVVVEPVFPPLPAAYLTGRQRVAARTVRAEVITALLAGALPAEAGGSPRSG
jgi:hypothetical protein